MNGINPLVCCCTLSKRVKIIKKKKSEEGRVRAFYKIFADFFPYFLESKKNSK